MILVISNWLKFLVYVNIINTKKVTKLYYKQLCKFYIYISCSQHVIYQKILHQRHFFRITKHYKGYCIKNGGLSLHGSCFFCVTPTQRQTNLNGNTVALPHYRTMKYFELDQYYQHFVQWGELYFFQGEYWCTNVFSQTFLLKELK